MGGSMVQAATATESPGAARVRAQEILLTAAATALLTLLAWLASSIVQVGKDIEQPRGEVALFRSGADPTAQRPPRTFPPPSSPPPAAPRAALRH